MQLLTHTPLGVIAREGGQSSNHGGFGLALSVGHATGRTGCPAFAGHDGIQFGEA
jgi:hypothetical protein